MANFHTNYVIITANEQGMMSVLRAMAESLCAHYEETGRSDLLLDATGARDAYSRVRGDIDAFYWYAFTPAPIGSEEWKRAHPDYQQNEMGANESYAAMGALANRIAEQSGLDVSVRIQPSGRPLSDTANVSMDRFGETYALGIEYSTAWENNFEDVSILFEALPEGEYGLAFLDADEYDSYESVSMFCGISHGASSGGAFSTEVEDACSAEELYERAQISSDDDLSRCADLSKIALTFAMCTWPEYTSAFDEGTGFDDDGAELYRKIDCFSGSSNHESYDKWNYRRAWLAEGGDEEEPLDFQTSPSDVLSAIPSNVVGLLKRFPFECEVTGQGYEGRNANIEHLVPGEVVMLKSDWNSPYFQGAGIEVYDASGRRLANLGGYFNPTDLDRVTIACLLPHITATAVNVQPLGAALDGRRRQGQFTLHLEIGPLDLNQAISEVGELLSANVEDRTRLSILAE